MATVAEASRRAVVRSVPRPLRWMLAGLALAAGLVLVGAIWLRHDLTSFILGDLLPEWRTRYDSEVTVESLSVRVFPTVRVVARGLMFRQHGRETALPLLRARQVEVTAGIAGVLLHPYHLRRLELDGFELNVPPKDERPPKPQDKKTVRTEFSIDEIRADASVLRMLPEAANGNPAVFHFRIVSLRGSGIDGDVRFRTVLSVPKPPGDVRAEGSFGPWDAINIGDMRVAGKYEFVDADLSVFPLVAGNLSSSGEFKGLLRDLNVHGSIDIPQFEVRDAKHPIQFAGSFEAVVNGTNGNTVIRSAQVDFLHSRISLAGEVSGDQGKMVSLIARMDEGRLEDILRFIVHDARPPFTGSAGFDWRYTAPLTGPDIVERMHLDGTATLGGVKPTRPGTREELYQLSAKAQGEPDSSFNVASDLYGRINVRGGVAHLHGVTFRTPGVFVTLAGDYGLRRETLDLRGTARMEATLSESTKGVKSFFLKILDPFFKRKNAGAAVPIAVTGTARNPSIHLALGR